MMNALNFRDYPAIICRGRERERDYVQSSMLYEIQLKGRDYTIL